MRNHFTAAALALGLLGVPAMAFDHHEKPAQEQKRTEARANKGKLKLVDLNTASEAELRQIPGVDAKMAKKIMDNRPYITVEDLAKSGIPVELQKSAQMSVTVSGQTDTGTADRSNNTDRKSETDRTKTQEKSDPQRDKDRQ